MLKRLLSFALLVGALTGLLGQGFALAHIPGPVVQQTKQMLSDDCMQMMAQPKPEKREAPCKGITLDCIAAMGCALPLAFVEPFVVPIVLPVARLAPSTAATQALTGHVVPPEPEPPSLV